MSVAKKNVTNNNSRKSPRIAHAKPSAALLAAKREGAERKRNLGNISTIIRDIYQKAIDAKDMIRHNTGVIYEPSMVEHKCLWDPNYPECPERLSRVLDRCQQLGLLERCEYISPRKAEASELLLKHTPGHLEIIKSTDNVNDVEKLEKLSSNYDAVYFHPKTYELSLLATGSTIDLVKNICLGNIQNGMAIIRPPGHHAMKSEYCGYCFFNNVAIAAEVALKNNLAKKILIVDWDVHHGQATQQMFYNDSRVVYFSIHRYEHGEFWPNLKESDYHYIGEGPGEGYNFNVPLNKTGMTNADYIAIFQQILLPMAYEFQPDLIIVSAGYDAALGCPEGQMNISPACYSHLLNMLMGLANGKIAVILEGGYCLRSLAESAALTLRRLLGDPCPMLENLEPPCESIQETILNVIYSHRSHWKCYQFQDTFNVNGHNTNAKQKKHLPNVIYKGPEEFPTVFETRNCYPVQNRSEVLQINKKLDHLVKITKLSKAQHQVGIVYDERMLKHYNVVDESHPERPSRISSIYSKHKDYGLLTRCHTFQGRLGSDQEILLAHTQEYLDSIKKTSETKLRDLAKQAGELNSVYFHPETWDSARVAVGSLLEIVDKVLNEECQSGVAIIRPPGHHAADDAACGFCIFNNIAIAAKYAVSKYGLKRVMVLDWDVHHGNGTQSILEDDPNVLYMSLHRYDNGNFFPHSKAADYTVVGTGKGEGFNVNIPFNKKGMGDVEYTAAFQQVVMPIAYQFNPELILVSAGFDACIGDPLGGFKLSPEMYGHMTHWLSGLANGRVVLSLEGGYNVNSIANAMSMCTKALLGDPLPALDPPKDPCCPSAVQSLRLVIETQRQYWPNLVFSDRALPLESGLLPKARVPRAKPTQRLLDGPPAELTMIQKSAEPPSQPSPFLPGSTTSLEEGLKKLSVRDCINPDQQQQRQKTSNEGAPGREEEQQNQSSASSSSQAPAGAAAAAAAATTLQDYLQSNLRALVEEQMFAVVPLRDCPHLRAAVRPVPTTGIDCATPCAECASTAENWVCLTCYSVHCARSVNQHALDHESVHQHPLALSFSDLSVWCYACEAYIDNPVLYDARNAVHLSKFKSALPWTYDTPRNHSDSD
ncbi:hypothetical protein TKK_0008310 [Trichogramma kaykai]|uniref:Protein deacetylase HDAC6 n=1 Tax=Trichogramma kaykai TaxID=54128 RepID=A0ABD2X4K5_9HYME